MNMNKLLISLSPIPCVLQGSINRTMDFLAITCILDFEVKFVCLLPCFSLSLLSGSDFKLLSSTYVSNLLTGDGILLYEKFRCTGNFVLEISSANSQI
jgi:hypothetical protein